MRLRFSLPDPAPLAEYLVPIILYLIAISLALYDLGIL